MNDKTEKLLQQLADKLGVTVQYLWETLVRGNRIEGAILWMFVLVGIGLIVAAYKLFRWIKDEGEDGAWGLLVAAMLASGIGISLGCFYWAVMDTFCPQYGALADILSHIK